MAGRWVCGLAVFWLTGILCAAADEVPPSQQFLAFIRQEAQALRQNDQPPATKGEWLARRDRIRTQLEAAWGGFPTDESVPESRKLAEVQRDGYRIEKLLLQTMPGVWMTALAYVPDTPGPHPAILSVHGHWKHAKVEPTIQSRAIGAVKLGFFVLAVDAFGAGERGIGEALGEYHGEMTGATLFPIGRPLSGIQVYENMRAVDYMQSRSEVDPAKIGITGASGGGNQTMYAGAWDDRFGAVVPVCSVGNYQAYLGAACCMCEVVPGALRFTEESGILGLVAPRSLMPCNVTRDGNQFSIREARKSLVGAQPMFDLLGVPDHLYHSTFRWTHDYHQPIREAMYGWMTQHLKGAGDGSPIPELVHATEPPEELRCFPGDSRPDDWLTLPQFAAREGRQLLANRQWPLTADGQPEFESIRTTLIEQVFGGFPKQESPQAQIVTHQDANQRLQFVAEPGITLALRSATADAVDFASPPPGDVVLLLNLHGAAAAAQSALIPELKARGCTVVTLDLRATGEFAQERDRVGRAPDHNSAEWALWIGRPLLGQWTWDVRQALAALQENWPRTEGRRYHVIGEGSAGIVALCVGATTPAADTITAMNTLSSYVSEVPYEKQHLGIMAPGLLRDVGDVAHLAVLALDRRVLIAGGVAGSGAELDSRQLADAFAPAQTTATTLRRSRNLQLMSAKDPAAIVDALTQ